MTKTNSMQMLELTLLSGKKIMFGLSNNFNVIEFASSANKNVNAMVNDGLHNNTGWPVQETYEEIINKLNT